jgi:hypothetical protein
LTIDVLINFAMKREFCLGKKDFSRPDRLLLCPGEQVGALRLGEHLLLYYLPLGQLLMALLVQLINTLVLKLEAHQ